MIKFSAIIICRVLLCLDLVINSRMNQSSVELVQTKVIKTVDLLYRSKFLRKIIYFRNEDFKLVNSNQKANTI